MFFTLFGYWVRRGGGGGQSADLHCIRCCKKLVSKLRALGQMTVTETGIVQWVLPSGDTVALQQFRDNFMVAAKGPTPHSTMYVVCQTMESI